MTKTTDTTPDVGVIVARFQVPELHAAHRRLIETVIEAHDKVLVFLGLPAVTGTQTNPLDFEARKQLLLEDFPRLNVHYIEDQPSDHAWSLDLDHQISRLTTPAQTAVLYGSRASFIEHYSGALPVIELASDDPVSGTAVREAVKRRSTTPSADFRAGVVWSTYAQFPMVHPTVDVAIFDAGHERLLLGRKPDDSGWRFVGGFADPASPSYEADARREVLEETGVEVSDPQYVTSMLIDDWRYRGIPDRAIKTLLFTATVLAGTPHAADDIAEVRWFDWATVTEADIINAHRPLLAALKARHAS